MKLVNDCLELKVLEVLSFACRLALGIIHEENSHNSVADSGDLSCFDGSCLLPL